MPWTWQNTASLPHFSSSGKTREVPISQAFQLYRKSCPGCLCLGFVVSSHCRFSCQSRCLWGTDLARSLPVCGAGQARWPRHPLSHAKPRLSSSSPSSVHCPQLRHRPHPPWLTNNSFTSYKGPNIICVLTGNTENIHQKLFSSKQQKTRVGKNTTLRLTDPSTQTEKPLQCPFDATLQVSVLTKSKRNWSQVKAPITAQSFDCNRENSTKPHYYWHCYNATSLEIFIFLKGLCDFCLWSKLSFITEEVIKSIWVTNTRFFPCLNNLTRIYKQ